MAGTTRVLILPGWQNAGPTHWQSRWQALHGFERMQQADWAWPRCGDWMAQLEEAVLADPCLTALVAHGLGCQLVAAWAAHTRHAAHIKGALLVAPPDTARSDMPPQLFTWRGIVCPRLPFPALLIWSTDDPFCTIDRALAMAADWGAEALSLGDSGPINGDSDLGDWPEGLPCLRRFTAAAR